MANRQQGVVPRPACSSFLKFKENGGQAYGKARQTAGLPENVSGGQRRSDRSIEGNREKNAVSGVRPEGRADHHQDSYERLLEEHNLPADEQADVETIVLRKILRKQLHEAIRNLEEGEQYLIIQLFFMDRSERELAEELGLSQKAVNKRRHKILRKLKKFLEKF